ncbi:transposase [Streptomyces sp. H10-C2]|uniref:transposase family protein n=1 Tax=unclassified Streptomyces TaxID=2593676 RepID=UPI0024BA013F|nr:MULTISPECIES: transposase family protein [unclassified Streptomyces]MDJ0340494.1 transposase [Streptomyces sp. PH10-H1]MDJ0370142.1 transposase [Streptomyces sp. H10-C2]
MKSDWARAACSDSALCGISKEHLGALIAELAGPWAAAREAEQRERRGHARLRAAGAGPGHQLVFVDRVLVTLVALRWGLSHKVLAVLFEVSASTVDRAVAEVRPLLAARGFAIPDRPGIRLRTLADVFAYAQAEGITLRIDGTEVQVRRPKAHRPGRKAFISGKKKQNTEKATMISDRQGRELWLGAIRPGRMHDATQVRTEGVEEQLRLHPNVRAEVDSGYAGLARDFPGQVSAPPKKPAADAGPSERNFYDYTRRRQSQRRIMVEHAIAEPKQWRSLQRWTGNRDDLPEVIAAIGALVSDRSAKRPTRSKPSTALVLAGSTAF